MSVAAAIRRMLAAGLTIEQALIAAEAFEVEAAPTHTARQERNRRHYEKRASEKRLNKTVQDVSDVSDVSTALSPKEKSPTPPKEITPIPLRCDPRDPLQGRVVEMLAALGVTDETKTPGLLILSEPYHWLTSGCEIDLDILPALRAIGAKGKRLNSWAYCTAAVFEARDRRLAPSPPVQQRSGAPPGERKPRNAGESARLELIQMQENGHAPLIPERRNDLSDRNTGFAGTDIARRIALASG